MFSGRRSPFAVDLFVNERQLDRNLPASNLRPMSRLEAMLGDVWEMHETRLISWKNQNLCTAG